MNPNVEYVVHLVPCERFVCNICYDHTLFTMDLTFTCIQYFILKVSHHIPLYKCVVHNMCAGILSYHT
jgi:hypothetical protein